MPKPMSYEAFEEGDKLYEVESVVSNDYGGVAIIPYGWQTEPDEDTEWSGTEVRTGFVVCVMVGDDRFFSQDPELLEPLKREDYCGECGQIGCHCDGYDRE